MRAEIEAVPARWFGPEVTEPIKLRLWDDAAKDPAAVAPSPAHFLDIAERVMR